MKIFLQITKAMEAWTMGVERMITDVHHATGHLGIRRTLYFARRTDPTVSKRQVISGCEPCKSLDPAPGKWKRGSLDVEEVWQRVGMDITHVRGRLYLTLIDCGPSRQAGRPAEAQLGKSGRNNPAPGCWGSCLELPGSRLFRNHKQILPDQVGRQVLPLWNGALQISSYTWADLS
ncbi:hypothetical protein T05_13731 [Trichinella murrelli]|uniref:Uncharacterized protein n=1 Tax=Trichinella murrelli TaxID=144512 RepID=A0A0V0TK75_9BILA|nr:hypothetical protein T05_13731 [Trichinella murrelli]